MITGGHLWAIGYDNKEGAERVRTEIAKLAEKDCLTLLDTAVAVHYPDGCFTLDGEPYVTPVKLGGGFAGFLAALALGAPPLTDAAVGALVGRTTNAAAESGISNSFISEIEALMKPGTSALFVLDQEGNMDAILQGIRGLGGRW
jgi:uncharacterized membrane protein